MTADQSLTPAYFDQVYAAREDPWDFETSDYERRKYAATVAALPRPRFGKAFEIGCSIGVLTHLLARRCDALLAVDVSDVALDKARSRLSNETHVRFEKMCLPAEFPPGRFDLIVMSEVGYYWARPDLETAGQRILQALSPRGVLLLVHWTPPVHDYPLTGDQVHEHFLRLAPAAPAAPLRHVAAQRERTYRLDVFESRSV